MPKRQDFQCLPVLSAGIDETTDGQYRSRRHHLMISGNGFRWFSYH